MRAIDHVAFRPRASMSDADAREVVIEVRRARGRGVCEGRGGTATRGTVDRWRDRGRGVGSVEGDRE